MIYIIQKILDIIVLPAELAIPLLLYQSACEHRSHFSLRAFLAGAIALFLPGILFYQLMELIPVPYQITFLKSLLYSILSYLTAAGFIFFCYELPWWEALYCSACAYLTQHFAYCAHQFIFPTAEAGTIDRYDIGYFTIYALVYAGAYFIFGGRLPIFGQYRANQVYSLTTTVVTLMTALVLCSLAQHLEQIDNTLYPVCLLYGMVCSFLVLWTQIGQQKRLSLQYELDLQQQLWHQRRAQYEISAENITLINQKCHDLKHQLAALKHITDPSQQKQSIQDLEKSVMIYDAIIETGNDILDAVLTDKSLLCEARGITLACMADGKCLSFMDAVDIYTIFGNALDNAIAEVSKLSDPDQKTITVTVFSRADIVFFQVENYYSTPLIYERGLPITTKPEGKGYHGFGLSSIRNTVEKYGGLLTIQDVDNIFLLRLTIPIY